HTPRFTRERRGDYQKERTALRGKKKEDVLADWGAEKYEFDRRALERYERERDGALRNDPREPREGLAARLAESHGLDPKRLREYEKWLADQLPRGAEEVVDDRLAEKYGYWETEFPVPVEDYHTQHIEVPG